MKTKKIVVIQILGLLFIVIAGVTYMNRWSTLNSLKALQQIRSSEDVVIVDEVTADDFSDEVEEEEVISERFSLSPLESNDASTSGKDYLSINQDYVGWLSIEGTRVDYPVVRGKDNSYYLKRTFDQRQSDLGAIFMDYRNLGQFLDTHTVIYGHYVKNGSMFGDLLKYLDSEFFYQNRIITLEGIYESKSYLIVSVYSVLADAYQIPLDQQPNYEYINDLVSLSMHTLEDIDAEILSASKLLTLATCTPGLENGRLIIHAIEL